MKLLSFIGKGGVGKSTLAVEMGMALKERGRTCVLGLDKQFNHSDIIRLNHYEIDHIETSTTISDMMKFVIENSQLNAYSEYLNSIAGDFIAIMNLGEMLHELQMKYDYVVIDFPPNHSGLDIVTYPDIYKNIVFKALFVKERVRRMLHQETPVLDKIDYLVEIADTLVKYIQEMDWYCLGIPTELGLLETQKAFERLTQLGLHVEKIIINMVHSPANFAKRLSMEKSMEKSIDTCPLCREIYAHQTTVIAKYLEWTQGIHLPLVQIPLTFDNAIIREILKKCVLD